VTDKTLRQFGKRIRQYRLARGLSQEELAEKANLHRTYIGAVERGERNASLKSILRIAKALEVSLEEVFKGWL
jgi:transcriptional regulator with XRE-family HTH domain